MYNTVLSVVQYRCEANLATSKHWFASIMEVSLVLLAFSLYSLFYAIYPKTTETLLLYSVAYIPQEYLPFTFKPFHHGPY